jgi:hypothetical protein
MYIEKHDDDESQSYTETFSCYIKVAKIEDHHTKEKSSIAHLCKK